MKWLLPFIVLCVGLAVLKVALIALAVALVLVLVYAFVTRPAQTVGFLVTLTIFSLASAQPVAFILTLGVVCVAVVVADARAKARSHLRQQAPLRSSDHREGRSPPE